MRLYLSTIIALFLLFVACKQEPDIPSVKIGENTWMVKNLDVSRFRNGDSIPEAKTKLEWAAYGMSKKAAWSHYNNDIGEGANYGKLYNWYAVNDPRGLAPEGWHIPTDVEWGLLVLELGGDKKAGEALKYTYGWANTNTGSGNGTNSSGFEALAGGLRNGMGAFGYKGQGGGWWSSTAVDSTKSWYRFVLYASPMVYKDAYGNRNGLAVRCVKDK
ncbi:MAG: hypothetical protein RLZZ196_2499 [Bacteroidota bacterium]|jgi:uncharacterized protein (TIGR02145 family)